ncbi:MAG: SIS domain-containing protein [Pseudomonadota bacterium]
MDSYQRIAESFQTTIEAATMTVDGLAENLSLASELLVNALLEDRKVVTAGSGSLRAMASLFAEQMMGPGALERPALPTITLQPLADNRGSSADESLARQLRALGQAGDVLLIVCGDSSECHGAIAAAAERSMHVICICVSDSSGMLATGERLHVSIAAADERSCPALATMAVTTLVELIETGLFGTE